MMQGEWCASMIVSFPDDFITNPPTLDRDSWLNWARRLIDGLVAREQPARTVVPIRAAA
jgi:hypothetical protein